MKDRGQVFQEEFGRLLRRLMDESKDARTIVALNAKSKVPTTTIARTLKADSAIGIDKLPDLASAFNMKPWEMLKELDKQPARDDAWVRPLTRHQKQLQQLATNLAGFIPDDQAEALAKLLAASVVKDLQPNSANVKERAAPSKVKT